jgi:hypothetical protein
MLAMFLFGPAAITGAGSANHEERNHQALQQMPRSQLAPLNLHEVLQVIVLPFMQALQTCTHWSIFRAS